MIVVPFEAWHIQVLRLQEKQTALSHMLTKEHAAALEREQSFTAIDEGEVLACAGVVKMWENRATAWALLSGDLKGKFIPVHRAVKRFLDSTTYARIDADVDIGFEEGHKWLKMLGFELEAPIARNYRPDGGHSSLYARIR